MFRDSKQLLDFLVKGYDFKTSMIDTCYNFAKFQYECGNYSGASEYLYFHRILVQVSLWCGVRSCIFNLPVLNGSPKIL